MSRKTCHFECEVDKVWRCKYTSKHFIRPKWRLFLEKSLTDLDGVKPWNEGEADDARFKVEWFMYVTTETGYRGQIYRNRKSELKREQKLWSSLGYTTHLRRHRWFDEVRSESEEAPKDYYKSMYGEK